MPTDEATPPGDSGLNPRLRRPARPGWTVAELAAALRRGDRVALGRAITLVESRRAADSARAGALIDALLPDTGRSFRLGITGVPGVGKSTFIEQFGLALIERGHRVAVLAVDPSSRISRGSILGDKTRMERLSVHPAAYIRPSPTGGSLGGVTAGSYETVLLCEAAGFDFIIIETVGVGQSETAVADLADGLLLLLLPGAGDDLQGIKRGIVEMADLLAVNKADGPQARIARQAQLDYRRALHLFPPKANGWTPRVLTCSAQDGRGIGEIVDAVADFRTHLQHNGFLEADRRQRREAWLQSTLSDNLLSRLREHATVAAAWPEVTQAVREGRLSVRSAVEQLWTFFQQTT